MVLQIDSTMRGSHVIKQCGCHKEAISLTKTENLLFCTGNEIQIYFSFYLKCMFQFTSESATPVAVFLSLHIFQIHCVFGIPVSLKKVF